jgi:hypothetical protein
VRAATLPFLLLLGACATNKPVPIAHFYDYWNPGPHGAGVCGTPTSSYEELFSTRGPQQKFFDASDHDFYDAARGDTSALRRFLHSPKADAWGAPGEEWIADMVVLALVYHDDGLYSALRREPRFVREGVGIAIESCMPKDRDSFIRTRTLYNYRKT